MNFEHIGILIKKLRIGYYYLTFGSNSPRDEAGWPLSARYNVFDLMTDSVRCFFVRWDWRNGF